MSARTGDLPEPLTEVPVVTTREAFVEFLRPGDVLLFDKLTSTNRLVQWADNRPVGHCAIWHDGRVFGGLDEEDQELSADRASSAGAIYEATVAPANSPERRSGVLHTALSDLLDLTVADGRGVGVPTVRTVTAMRYPELTDEQRRRVLDYARSQVAVAGFAKLQLALLAPYALARSYARVLPGSARAVAEQEAAQPLHRAAELAAVAASCRDSARRARRRGNAAARMFCSELVFRAYEAAFAPIEIIDPLYDRRSRRRRSLAPGTGSARGRDVRYGQPETESAFAERGAVSDWAEPAEIRSVLDAYDDFVELDVLSDPDLAPSRTPGGSADLGAAEGGLAGPRDPGPGGPLNPARRLEFADMITPGDYWSSPSLDPVAALHRTPDRRR